MANSPVLPLEHKSVDKSFWDRFWSEASALHPLGHKASELIEELLHGTPKVDCILEIGVGDGRNLPALMSRGKRVIGVDFSEIAIKRAGSRILRNHAVELLFGSAYALPLANDSCDIALAADVMHHLDAPERFCSELWRILRKGGQFLGNAMSLRDPSREIVCSNRAEVSPQHFSIRWNGGTKPDLVWLTMRYYSKEELEKLFRGFVWVTPPTEYVREDQGHPPPFDSRPHQHVFWKLHLKKP